MHLNLSKGNSICINLKSDSTTAYLFRLQSMRVSALLARIPLQGTPKTTCLQMGNQWLEERKTPDGGSPGLQELGEHKWVRVWGLTRQKGVPRVFGHYRGY